MSDTLFKRLMLNAEADPSALMVEAAKHIAHLEAQLLSSRGDAENARIAVDKLNTRLENNFAWRMVDNKMVKIDVLPGSIPDGIDCRNETIKLLEARIKELEKKDA